MSKLTKLIKDPRQFFEDAKIKKLVGKNNRADADLKKAKKSFSNGDLVTAQEQLGSISDLSACKHLLATRILLFLKDYLQASASARLAMQLAHVKSSDFREAFYLHQEALRLNNQHEQASSMLESMPFADKSARYYRALRLSALALNNPALFEKELIKVKHFHPQWLRANNNYLLLLRDSGKHQQALRHAEFMLQVERSGPTAEKTKQPPIKTDEDKKAWQKRAGLALQQLQQDLSAWNIRFFLVSGTLLGCVREGSILGHDTDIDVGIMPEVSMEALKQAVHASSRFRMLDIKSEHTLYLVHTSGVKIDVFRHYRENNRFYHEGIKCRWWNSQFELSETEFLGDKYLMPANPDKYLTENYGDWRTPVHDFATFLDTPNMETTHTANMALYLFTQAIAAHKKNEQEKYLRYHQAAKELLMKDITPNV
jgi:tetratricopeptide (TPR) repeat protein